MLQRYCNFSTYAGLRISCRSIVLVLSRLHYCNAVLAGLSAATLQCRRCRVVNAAARLVFDLNRRDIDNVTSALRELHIIDYPLNNESSTSCACSFTDHISDLHTPVADMPSRSSWRTSSNGNLLLSRTERRFPLDIFLSTSFLSLSLLGIVICCSY